MPFYTPVDFDYYAPRNVDEAVTLLSEKEDSVIIAGGQTLLTLLKLRILRPKNVIDLSKVSSLRYIKEENGEIRIGAITVHNEVARSQLIASRCGLLSAAAGRIGDEQVRNRGTIGGSVANADPSANYEPVLLALDARFTLIGPQGRREVGAREFFVDAYTTAINKGEVLTEVKVRELSEVGYSFKKAARREQEFAIVNVAALLWLEGDEIKDVRVAVGE
ncbi:hypothetical protein HS1genome_0543 [Sulfodiicoccus acidiphilus]|uniref:FAD-binding PCMH-type domain-containing protein n=1 Tax=Sulfodiicoccus acidiphilus TaxID=1670455 RepID=A0A348B1V2_9CREN|nr:hypothetical protein HS1genome_0543 [Sulfodiicoccus acidiphilus]